jgi:RNA polymerase sigma-70 factor (ECF subfamily)
MKKEKEDTLNCDVPGIWLEHQGVVRNFIRKRVPDSDTANDIAQEVLLKMYKFCLSKSGVRNVRSWLLQIARNSIVDYYRKQGRISFDLPDIVPEEEEKAYTNAAELIEPILSFLPEEYAIPLKLADIQGMKQADVARELGLSLTATKSRIQRARKLLKVEFVTCCHLETDKAGSLISFTIKESCEPLQVYVKSS